MIKYGPEKCGNPDTGEFLENCKFYNLKCALDFCFLDESLEVIEKVSKLVQISLKKDLIEQGARPLSKNSGNNSFGNYLVIDVEMDKKKMRFVYEPFDKKSYILRNNLIINS